MELPESSPGRLYAEHAQPRDEISENFMALKKITGEEMTSSSIGITRRQASLKTDVMVTTAA